MTKEREEELKEAMESNIETMDLLSWGYHDGGEIEWEDGEQEFMKDNYDFVVTLVKKGE